MHKTSPENLCNIFLKIFEKPIDFLYSMEYNIITERERKIPNTRKGMKMTNSIMTEFIKRMNTDKAFEKKAVKELEKMFGLSIDKMTVEQKKIGLICLAVFEAGWNK